MRQNIQNRSKELSCPKGFPKAGRQLIRKSWVATGMLNDLVASKSFQVHKLRFEKRKDSPDSRVDRYGSTSTCWRYLPLPRPYVSQWPNELGKEENHGRGKPGAPNKTPETRPKQGPSATCSLEPRGFLNEASFPRGRRGPALRHSCQRLCAGLQAAKLHRHVALLATLSPTTPARRPSKQHGVSDTTPFAFGPKAHTRKQNCTTL